MMTEPDDLSALKVKPFSQAVEKFEGLLAQSSKAFLIGAGCSKCTGLTLTMDQLPRSNDIDFVKGWQSPAMSDEQLQGIANRWRYQKR